MVALTVSREDLLKRLKRIPTEYQKQIRQGDGRWPFLNKIFNSKAISPSRELLAVLIDFLNNFERAQESDPAALVIFLHELRKKTQDFRLHALIDDLLLTSISFGEISKKEAYEQKYKRIESQDQGDDFIEQVLTWFVDEKLRPRVKNMECYSQAQQQHSVDDSMMRFAAPAA